ncbi:MULTISPECIES: aminotransferase class V-fold PLP-dependent enzyme [unclassified Bradyrhizobium]|uniref:aminotransferase class V-fold PLP-dependent enzyme n=2 Tax=unclassified Bradyrhizobium TaxID=2631580 RepID=UPI0028E88257|nr:MULTISPECIES: aminotransferase class V-fold PLP-dependent enzyme [unclassified Bradyrhizobium]
MTIRSASTDIVHLNAAGAGLMPESVTAAITSHLHLERRRGAHWAMQEAGTALDETRLLAARLLGVEPHHLAFGEQTSRLWALAFASMPLERGDRILLARNDWGGNILNVLQRAQASGAEIIRLPMSTSGLIDVERTASLIDDSTAAICVSAVASSFGALQPVAALGALPRPEHCLYFVDGAQAVGQFDVTLPGVSADVMVAPARKWLRGGRGQAMMALSGRAMRRLGAPPVLDQIAGSWQPNDTFRLREDARRFETWEFSAAGRLGLRAALQELNGIGVAGVRADLADKLSRLETALHAVPGFQIFESEHGDRAFLTLHHARIPADALVHALATRDIAIASIGPDYARWELESRGLDKIARIAPHIYTTNDDLARCADEIARIVQTQARTD